jgi:AraC-like DNA-binding protein
VQESGTGLLRCAGQELTLRPGQAALCDPGAELHWRRPVSFVRLAFDLVDRPRVTEDGLIVWHPEPATPQPPLAEVFCKALPCRIPQAETAKAVHLVEFCTAYWWRSPGEQIRCSLEIGRWILDYAQRHGAAGFSTWERPEEGDLADRADAVIKHQCGAGWGVAHIAEQLGVSREHLSRTYRRLRGHSIQHYLMLLRLHGAQAFLEQRDEDLATVARRNGFGSLESLRRNFRKHMGVSPITYRRRYRQAMSAGAAKPPGGGRQTEADAV